LQKVKGGRLDSTLGKKATGTDNWRNTTKGRSRTPYDLRPKQERGGYESNNSFHCRRYGKTHITRKGGERQNRWGPCWGKCAVVTIKRKRRNITPWQPRQTESARKEVPTPEEESIRGKHSYLFFPCRRSFQGGPLKEGGKGRVAFSEKMKESGERKNIGRLWKSNDRRKQMGEGGGSNRDWEKEMNFCKMIRRPRGKREGATQGKRDSAARVSASRRVGNDG